MAGMDGNRTHPGRLNSAPQTVLKTAGLASTAVHQRPSQFDSWLAHSMVVRGRLQMSSTLAVNLAVMTDRAGLYYRAVAAAAFRRWRRPLLDANSRGRRWSSHRHRQLGPRSRRDMCRVRPRGKLR